MFSELQTKRTVHEKAVDCTFPSFSTADHASRLSSTADRYLPRPSTIAGETPCFRTAKSAPPSQRWMTLLPILCSSSPSSRLPHPTVRSAPCGGHIVQCLEKILLPRNRTTNSCFGYEYVLRSGRIITSSEPHEDCFLPCLISVSGMSLGVYSTYR